MYDMVKEKEKLVWMYITIATILSAFQGKEGENELILAAYFVFIITVIFYYNYLRLKNTIWMYIFGSIVSLCFSIIVTNLAVSFSSDLRLMILFEWFFLCPVIAIYIGNSLINPSEKPEIIEEKYQLY